MNSCGLGGSSGLIVAHIMVFIDTVDYGERFIKETDY